MDLDYERLTTISIICQLYCGDQIYCLRKPEYMSKTIDMPKVSENPVLEMLYRVHLAWEGTDQHISPTVIWK
jgi:hypothetical protein